MSFQTANQSSTVFALPAGGQVTQWQTNTSGACMNAAGEAANLAALAPLPGGAFRVDAVDMHARWSHQRSELSDRHHCHRSRGQL